MEFSCPLSLSLQFTHSRSQCRRGWWNNRRGFPQSHNTEEINASCVLPRLKTESHHQLACLHTEPRSQSSLLHGAFHFPAGLFRHNLRASLADSKHRQHRVDGRHRREDTRIRDPQTLEALDA